MADFSRCKLGKLPARVDDRTLRLASYLRLPPLPKACDWSTKVTVFGEMLNASIGDCTVAGAGHMVQTWTANTGAEQTVPDAAILAAYEAVSGYNPDDPSTDQGADLLTVLNYWRKTGVGGHQILAYMQVRSKAHLRAAIDLFGGAYLGLALPVSAQQQAVWAVPRTGIHGDGERGSWGGHCVAAVAYDVHYVTCVTWGALLRMTWQFLLYYMDEAFAVLSPAEWCAGGKCPAGFDLAALEQDLKAVTG